MSAKTNWQAKKLGEVCDIGAGNSAPQKKEFFVNGIYPFFRTSDVGQIHIGSIMESSDHLNEKGIKGLKLFNKGTILLPKSGASTFLNHRVVLGTDGFVSSHLATIKTDEIILNSSYLFYFLQEIKAQDLIQDHKYPSLNLSVIGEIKISYPESIPEQKRIVKILDQVFADVARAKENAEKNLQNSKELFESYLQNIFANPGKDWEEKRLGDICKIIAGQSPEGKFYNKLGKGLPFYQGKKEFREKYIGEPTTWTTNITKEALENDILMSVRAPVGPINFATQKICIGRGLAAIRSGNNIDKDFIFYGILSKEKEIIGNAGAVFASINKNDIENLEFFIPYLTEQKSIVKKLDALAGETKKLEAIYRQKLADLEELKKSVLKKAFKGEL